jgi:hypothetical protein
MVSSDDIPSGQKINAIFRPFIEDMISSKLTERTIKRHIDNLWLLGGELIRCMNIDPEAHGQEVLELLLENIGPDGGPYCRHLDTEAELKSFDSTCRKLFKYIQSTMA